MTRATTFRAVAVFSGFLIAILMVMSVSRALFTNPTSNDENAWTSGSVVLVNEFATTDGGPGPADFDETGAALFAITDIVPGDSDTFCIEVIYEGSVDADILIDSVSQGAGGVDENSIGDDLNLTITRWLVDCGDTADGTVAGGTINTPTYSETAWQPITPGIDESRWYEITVELDTNADNSVQDSTIDEIEFEWLATNN